MKKKPGTRAREHRKKWTLLSVLAITLIIVLAVTSYFIIRQSARSLYADFVYTPNPPSARETVTFNASKSYNVDGVVTSYNWTFGDGNVTTISNPITTHVYETYGNYTVVLTIADDNGRTDSKSGPIQVRQESSKYFAFSEFGAAARTFGGINTTIKIIELTFTFTPVGGDANEVTVFAEGGVAATDYFWLHIQNGTLTYVDIQYEHGITSSKQANGYPVTFRLFSHEANGDITLVIPEGDIIFV
jgi:PKD repeat protein